MKVKDLLLRLQEMPKDAYIVIDNRIVNAVELEDGRFKEGYMVDGWLPFQNGNKEAVRFSYLSELSDGSLTDIKF